MKFTAEQIAGILEGSVVGDPNIEVSKLAKIEEGTQGSLTFLANPKYKSYIYTTKASITIVNSDFEPEEELSTTLIKVEDAYGAFTKLLDATPIKIAINRFKIAFPQRPGNFCV